MKNNIPVPHLSIATNDDVPFLSFQQKIIKVEAS